MLTPIQAVQLRKQLGKVLVAVATNQQRFVIHRAGIPTAVLVPFQEYQRILSEVGERKEGNLPSSRSPDPIEEGKRKDSEVYGRAISREDVDDITKVAKEYPGEYGSTQ